MIQLLTIRELSDYTDWADDRLMRSAVGRTDAQLDRPFAMGEGSLRATLRHIYGAERIWAERVRVPGSAELPKSGALNLIADLRQAARTLAEARRTWLGGLSAEATGEPLTYTNMEGRTYTNTLGDILLHVCIHGVHHRAQALNMIRHLGAPPIRPGLDYAFMKLEQAAPEPAGTTGGASAATPAPYAIAEPAAIDLDSIRAFFAYGDWARARVHAVAVGLNDEQLDRPFEIGSGSVRSTLVHIRDGEQWWLENWTRGSGQPFPETDRQVPIPELTRRFDQIAAERNQFLDGLRDTDLARPVSATPRPNITRTFSLGVTLLQLCCHGTHHRAQLLNMFRHVGAAVPSLDYVVMHREKSSA